MQASPKYNAAMNTLRTPAQSYAFRIIELIDAGKIEEVQKSIIERPMTLRNAMNQYLYKSVMKRKTSRRKTFSKLF